MNCIVIYELTLYIKFFRSLKYQAKLDTFLNLYESNLILMIVFDFLLVSGIRIVIVFSLNFLIGERIGCKKLLAHDEVVVHQIALVKLWFWNISQSVRLLHVFRVFWSFSYSNSVYNVFKVKIALKHMVKLLFQLKVTLESQKRITASLMLRSDSSTLYYLKFTRIESASFDKPYFFSLLSFWMMCLMSIFWGK